MNSHVILLIDHPLRRLNFPASTGAHQINEARCVLLKMLFSPPLDSVKKKEEALTSSSVMKSLKPTQFNLKSLKQVKLRSDHVTSWLHFSSCSQVFKIFAAWSRLHKTSYRVGGRCRSCLLTKAFYSCCWKISHMLSVETQGMTVGASKDFSFLKRKRKGRLLWLSIRAEWCLLGRNTVGLAWRVHTIMRSNYTVPVLIPQDLIVRFSAVGL